MVGVNTNFHMLHQRFKIHKTRMCWLWHHKHQPFVMERFHTFFQPRGEVAGRKESASGVEQGREPHGSLSLAESIVVFI